MQIILDLLDSEQKKKLKEWKENRSQYSGSIGGQFIYILTPTSLGVIIKIKDGLNDEILDLTDYDSW